MKIFVVTVLAMATVISADPAVFLTGGLLSSPLTSAALVAPAASPVVSPYSSIASVAPVAPLSPLTQVLSNYRYGYGSSYSYQDFPVVSTQLNSALTSLPYSLPYAYAADWYYRK